MVSFKLLKFIALLKDSKKNQSPSTVKIKKANRLMNWNIQVKIIFHF